MATKVRTPKGSEAREDAIERLQRGWKSVGPGRTVFPNKLPIGDVATLPILFQPRTAPLEAAHGAVDQQHVRALIRALRAKPRDARELDPVTVYACGGEAFLIDGHHRLEAYRQEDLDTIPVEWFEGTPTEAAAKALEANQKAKLPMLPAERLEGAWTLVLMGDGLSKQQTAISAGVSNGTVGNLRRLLADFREAFPGKKAGSLAETRNALAGDAERDGRFDDEMKEAMIERFRVTLGTTFGKEPAKHPELFAEALDRYAGAGFTLRLADYWGYKLEE